MFKAFIWVVPFYQLPFSRVCEHSQIVCNDCHAALMQQDLFPHSTYICKIIWTMSLIGEGDAARLAFIEGETAFKESSFHEWASDRVSCDVPDVMREEGEEDAERGEEGMRISSSRSAVLQIRCN